MVRDGSGRARDGHPIESLLGLVTFARLPYTGRVKVAFVALLAAALVTQASPASGASPYSAAYQVPLTPPTMGAGAAATIQVTVTNTGTATWNPSGANPVNLTYHWYDASGAVAVWDGDRTALGGEVPPGSARTLNAQVSAPSQTGPYQLRFALVKEGVLWFDPEPVGHSITLTPAYSATFGLLTLPSFVAGGTYPINVPVTNSGAALWNAAVPNAVNLAYHWFDAAGSIAAWDGTRTPLQSDLLAGSSRTLQAAVTAPDAPGIYSLAFDLVREGLAWFNQPTRLTANVDAATFRATYSVGAISSAFIGESKTLAVSLTNTGNVPWSSATTPNPVNLGYHWYDETNTSLVLWDGPRTALPSIVAPGASATVQLKVAMPPSPGAYTLRVELVREGLAWFSSLGTPPASLAFQISSGLGVAYGGDTMPGSITNGAPFPVSVTVQNTGQRTWSAGGDAAVRLSYHIYDAAGNVVVWDGARGALPQDVAPGLSVTVIITPIAPGGTGTYTLKWDLVQDGVAWFSTFGLATKSSTLSVFPGVTFYGKGWGHGVGMSQWGAQGWATGVAGPPLTGEQIVAKYFPGAALTPITTGTPFRVLLSAPSTGCNGRTIYGAAHLRSDGGLRVVRYNDRNQVLGSAGPGETITVWLSGSGLTVTNPSGGVAASGGEPLAAVGGDVTRPLTVDEKLRFYRGILVFENLSSQLRVTNQVNPDEYTRGSVPVEMPTGWHVEAYKAQAYAARTYAASSQSLSRPYDVRDDTSDQCYGGASVETTPTNQAADATAGRILTYQGAPIRAYYASSDGGAVDANGCVWNVARTPSGGYACGPSLPYLGPVADPADLAAVGPNGPNPHRSWVVSVGSAQIENAVAASGAYIGSFLSMDLSNLGPGGHVISVRVRGTAGIAEFVADSFLRTRLGLKSAMVRTAPF